MSDMQRYVVQRATALVMAPLVLIHLALIVYAVRGGVSAAEILSRTQGSVAWACFYGVFVVAAALHAAVGVGTVIEEWTPLAPPTARKLAGALALLLMLLGLRAVYTVIAT